MQIKAIIRNERGWLLAATLITVTTLASIALAMGLVVYYKISAEGRYEARERARFIAEAGLATYVYQYWIQHPDSTPASQQQNHFAGGEYTVYKLASDTLRVVGTFEGRQIEIVAALTQSNAAWNYVLMAGEELEVEHDASGQIVGNVHANEKVKQEGSVTVQGQLTQGSPEVDLPTVNWDYFKQQAINAGQFVSGKKTFDEDGSPYSGVWYVTREAKVKDNVVFTGVLISEKKIKVEGDDVSLQPATMAQPVLLSREKVDLKGDRLQVKGFIYADKELKFKGDSLRFEGSACAKKEVELEGTDFILRYNADYLASLQGVTFTGQASANNIKIVHWTEQE